MGVTASTRSYSWRLGRQQRYSWRVAVIVDELTGLLQRTGRLSQLARPDLLDRVASEVAPTAPARARALVRTDLLALERFIGGRRAYERHLSAIIEDAPVPHE